MKTLALLILTISLMSCGVCQDYSKTKKIPYKNCKTYKGQKHKYHQRHLRHDGCNKI